MKKNYQQLIIAAIGMILLNTSPKVGGFGILMIAIAGCDMCVDLWQIMKSLYSDWKKYKVLDTDDKG